jgi:hypothetical protein
MSVVPCCDCMDSDDAENPIYKVASFAPKTINALALNVDRMAFVRLPQSQWQRVR